MKVKEFFKEYLNGEEELHWVGKVIDKDVNVLEIKYHEPQGEGDAHYVTVLYSDGSSMRVFRPDRIDFY